MVAIEPRATRRNAGRVVLEIAEAQRGLVTRAQIVKAGLDPHVISRMEHSRWLRRLHRGVYQVALATATHMAERAALLACGGGVLSHWTAAELRELTTARADRTVHLTVTGSPRPHGGRRAGIVPHRHALSPDEIQRHDDLPLTTGARTLLDLAGLISERQFEQALAAAERAEPDVVEQVRVLLGRYPGRCGSMRLRAVLDRGTEPAFTRSEAEETLLSLIRSSGLPLPKTNAKLEYEVDFYWPDARLVVEVDAFACHGSRAAFLRDRRRDSALAARGVRVLRLSWQQLTRDRDRTLVQLALALHCAGA